MNTIIIFITIILFLAMAIAGHFDTRRPSSVKIKYKYRVKDNSILRKIIKFKDKQYYPCNYFKVVPIYIYLVLTLISLIVLIIDLFTNFYITNNYQIVLIVIYSIILIVSILYVIFIIVWWELVDYKTMRFTKKEKDMLKKIKKISKKNRNKL